MTLQQAITWLLDESYDDRQLAARLVTWLCCKRTVYAVKPEHGCVRCR